MKKLFALLFVVTIIATMFALPVTAVEGYTGKIIDVIYDPETETCSLPEGTVVYIGDTLVMHRKEMVFVGDFANEETGELETGIGVKADNFKLYTSEGRYYAQIWSDNILVNENIFEEGRGWKQGYGTLAAEGSYELRVASLFGYNLDAEIPVLTFDVVDPQYVDEIVGPGGVVETESSEELVESVEPVESLDPVESADDDIDSMEPTESIDDSDVPVASNNTVLWIIIGVLAVAVVLLVVLLTKKKK